MYASIDKHCIYLVKKTEIENQCVYLDMWPVLGNVNITRFFTANTLSIFNILFSVEEVLAVVAGAVVVGAAVVTSVAGAAAALLPFFSLFPPLPLKRIEASQSSIKFCFSNCLSP